MGSGTHCSKIDGFPGTHGNYANGATETQFSPINFPLTFSRTFGIGFQWIVKAVELKGRAPTYRKKYFLISENLFSGLKKENKVNKVPVLELLEANLQLSKSSQVQK